MRMPETIPGLRLLVEAGTISLVIHGAKDFEYTSEPELQELFLLSSLSSSMVEQYVEFWIVGDYF